MNTLNNNLLRLILILLLFSMPLTLAEVSANFLKQSKHGKELTADIIPGKDFHCAGEARITIKDWMHDVSYWVSGTLTVVEEDLVIEDWMTNKYYWNICPGDYYYPLVNRESYNGIEQWMVDPEILFF